MARLPAAYSHAFFLCARRGALPARFAVVTAHDPRGRKTAPALNRRRDAALRRELRSRKIPHFRVTGGNEDGSHREPGWGLILESPATARALSEQFGQLAFFWISSGRIYLGASAGGRLTRAGSWNARRARWRSSSGGSKNQ